MSHTIWSSEKDMIVKETHGNQKRISLIVQRNCASSCKEICRKPIRVIEAESLRHEEVNERPVRRISSCSSCLLFCLQLFNVLKLSVNQFWLMLLQKSDLFVKSLFLHLYLLLLCCDSILFLFLTEVSPCSPCQSPQGRCTSCRRRLVKHRPHTCHNCLTPCTSCHQLGGDHMFT